MEMTELQIASEYRTGKDKTKTIKVLAELNLVTQRQIAEILQAQGEELPKHWKEKLAVPSKRPPQEPAALLPVPAPAALSLDEIRQAALELILHNSPGDPARFHGYALGIAALVDALQEKLEGKKT